MDCKEYPPETRAGLVHEYSIYFQEIASIRQYEQALSQVKR